MGKTISELLFEKDARIAELEAVIRQVKTAAMEGLADCDDDCDMSSLWVLEALEQADRAAPAPGWEPTA